MGGILTTKKQPVEPQKNNWHSRHLLDTINSLHLHLENARKKHDRLEKERIEQDKRIKALEMQLNDMKKREENANLVQLANPSPKSIDEFVDKWYEENKDVDIGVIRVPFIGKVDVFPDRIEKHIYKKSLHIASSLMTEMLQNIQLQVLDKCIKIVVDENKTDL